MTLLRNWWQQPDHFEWLSNYLQIRAMTGPVRIFFGSISMSFVLLPVDGWLRRGDFDDTVPVIAETVGAVLGVIVAVLWFRAWPSKTQSLVYALVGSSTTVLWSMLQSDHMFGLLVCATLTFSGGYFALFHAPPWTVWNLLIAATGAGANGYALAHQGEVFHAVLGVWIVMAMNTAAPLAAQSLCRALGADLSASELDPLTGLLNRRTLYQRMAGATDGRSRERHLSMTMVDLDSFKRLNDTRGHSTGDEALVDVARILREVATEATLLFRFGGEEFLAVDIHDRPTRVAYPEEICQRIAALPYGISASVGSVETSLDSRCADKPMTDALIARADAAMYEAKRLGGDQVIRQG